MTLDLNMEKEYRKELLLAHIASAKLFRLKGMVSAYKRELSLVRAMRALYVEAK